MVNLFGGSIFICSYLIYDGFQSSSTYDQKRQISASALKAYKENFFCCCRLYKQKKVYRIC